MIQLANVKITLKIIIQLNWTTKKKTKTLKKRLIPVRAKWENISHLNMKSIMRAVRVSIAKEVKYILYTKAIYIVKKKNVKKRKHVYHIIVNEGV